MPIPCGLSALLCNSCAIRRSARGRLGICGAARGDRRPLHAGVLLGPVVQVRGSRGRGSGKSGGVSADGRINTPTHPRRPCKEFQISRKNENTGGASRIFERGIISLLVVTAGFHGGKERLRSKAGGFGSYLIFWTGEWRRAAGAAERCGFSNLTATCRRGRRKNGGGVSLERGAAYFSWHKRGKVCRKLQVYV